MAKPGVINDLCNELWDTTKTDWHYVVSGCLTEPTCCVVDIFSDDEALPQLKGFLGIGDPLASLAMALRKMLEMVKAKA